MIDPETAKNRWQLTEEELITMRNESSHCINQKKESDAKLKKIIELIPQILEKIKSILTQIKANQFHENNPLYDTMLANAITFPPKFLPQLKNLTVMNAKSSRAYEIDSNIDALILGAFDHLGLSPTDQALSKTQYYKAIKTALLFKGIEAKKLLKELAVTTPLFTQKPLTQQNNSLVSPFFYPTYLHKPSAPSLTRPPLAKTQENLSKANLQNLVQDAENLQPVPASEKLTTNQKRETPNLPTKPITRPGKTLVLA